MSESASRYAHRNTIFLLSPARCGGERGLRLIAGQGSELAQRLQTPGGAPVCEVFAFLSSLYFRGKLAYARAFARPPRALQGVYVITPGAGLLHEATAVTAEHLRGFASVAVDHLNEHYAAPLLRDVKALAAGAGDDARFVLLGSIASSKYVDPLLQVLGYARAVPRRLRRPRRHEPRRTFATRRPRRSRARLRPAGGCNPQWPAPGAAAQESSGIRHVGDEERRAQGVPAHMQISSSALGLGFKSTHVSNVAPTIAARAWQYPSPAAPVAAQLAAQVGVPLGTHAIDGEPPAAMHMPFAHGLPRKLPVGKHASCDTRHERPVGQALASPHAGTRTSVPGLATQVSAGLTAAHSASPPNGPSHSTTHLPPEQIMSASARPPRF